LRYTLPLMIVLTLLAAPGARAEIRTETVDYQDGDTTLQGFLAWDDAIEGPRPGVLVIHEWWGHNDYARGRARDLATLGYVAFALDMYGKDKVTTDPAKAREWAGAFYRDPALALRRARSGLDVLMKHALTDRKRVAAIGYCFGGTMVLNLAYRGTDIAGVVSFHGGLIDPPDGAKIRAKILVCHGADDPMVPEAKVSSFQKAMRSAGADWQFIAYGGAVHAFTNPAADRAGIPGVAYNEAAARRSWEHMKVFFRELF